MTMIESMVLAFNDEMELQRVAHGWPLYPKPPFWDWPKDEQEAAVACMEAALKVQREWSVE